MHVTLIRKMCTLLRIRMLRITFCWTSIGIGSVLHRDQKGDRSLYDDPVHLIERADHQARCTKIPKILL